MENKDVFVPGKMHGTLEERILGSVFKKYGWQVKFKSVDKEES